MSARPSKALPCLQADACCWKHRRQHARLAPPSAGFNPGSLARSLAVSSSNPCSFQWRDQCHKCGVPKPEEGAEADVAVAIDPGLQPGQMARPGDWRCTACNNIK